MPIEPQSTKMGSELSPLHQGATQREAMRLISTDLDQDTQSVIQVVRSDAGPSPGPGHGDDDNPSAVWATVSGRLDRSTADAFADGVVEMVFALPPRDLVLDLRAVEEIGEEGANAICCAHLALDDQGAHLVVLCSPAVEPTLEVADVDLDIVLVDP